jgi:hypothetical protein
MGWRLDGHHICFSFSVNNNKLIRERQLPWFQSSIVQDGDQKERSIEN